MAGEKKTVFDTNQTHSDVPSCPSDQLLYVGRVGAGGRGNGSGVDGRVMMCDDGDTVMSCITHAEHHWKFRHPNRDVSRMGHIPIGMPVLATQVHPREYLRDGM